MHIAAMIVAVFTCFREQVISVIIVIVSNSVITLLYILLSKKSKKEIDKLKNMINRYIIVRFVLFLAVGVGFLFLISQILTYDSNIMGKLLYMLTIIPATFVLYALFVDRNSNFDPHNTDIHN